ncbi:MAG: DUF3305 domain-containing protein [Alphaproteobacteria bacterium]|nr:DUF3305 domain-containing protein [Alphaproteobacteria bacterium]
MTEPQGGISERMNVGVVLERRRLVDPWRDHVWHAVEVVPGAPPDLAWRELVRSESAIRYLAATLPIEIFRKETESYRMNLIGQAPRVFVVLRPDPDNTPGREMWPFLATVCPFEASNYGQGGDETVDAVPMPDEIRAWLDDFVAYHHVPEVFVKRQRDRADPDKVGFGRRGPGEGRRG